MLGALAIDEGFFRYVLRGLFPMLATKRRSKIALPMLTTVNKSNNMVAVPSVTRPDCSTRKVANAAVPSKHPKLNPARDWRIVGFSDPLRQ